MIVPEIEQLAAGHENNQINSIELALTKVAGNSNLLKNFQNEIKALERFGTAENMLTVLQIYQEQGITGFIAYSHKICSTAIESKITTDLQTMKNKFDPNYSLGMLRFCDVVIYDFKGQSHTVPEDYLAAIGKDKQVMQYIKPESKVAQEIKYQLKNIVEVQKNQGIRIKN